MRIKFPIDMQTSIAYVCEAHIFCAHMGNECRYKLQFILKLPYKATTRLLLGQLELFNTGLIEDTFQATSGCIGNQYKGAWTLKGKGPLPHSSLLPERCYWVKTAPISLKHVKGVEGNFYPILPFTVHVNGRERGDFGVHADRNAPGSAGCIVLPSIAEWAFFQASMEGAREEGVEKIPLTVDYPIKTPPPN